MRMELPGRRSGGKEEKYGCSELEAGVREEERDDLLWRH